MTEVPGSRVVTVREADADKVTHIAWSPDGAAIGVGTAEGTVSLIDLSGRSIPLAPHARSHDARRHATREALC